ncbi:MAG: AmmeMemoRadiSam system protein B [Syntrophales bacterium]|nr:AmmeMemoRadiSam system protein B [Syntrophales bacterium]MDY0043500.1 AmmeMemoRadiSam system protein B [Syntrophales bacterium]
MEKPQLRRDLQLIPAAVKGRRVIVFMDPLRLAEGNLVCDMELFTVLVHLDGNHSYDEIKKQLVKAPDGVTIGLAPLRSLLDSLDKYYLLENDRFRNHMDNLHKEFKALSFRRPVHAGKAYEGDPLQLAADISSIEEELPLIHDDSSDLPIAGILAPHIDIGVAKSTYVDLYRRIKGKSYERVIILGINHQVQDGLYCVSSKNFITPFGRIEPDIPFINELQKFLPQGTLTADDFGHKMEHSIEFQTTFLHHYLTPSFKIVPILCGSIHEFIHERKSIFDDIRFRKTAEMLLKAVTGSNSRTLIISAVDLSHIGLKFGHQKTADDLLSNALFNDRLILSFIKDPNAGAIFEHSLKTEDRYNVCGLPSIILFTKVMEGFRGKCLAHRVYHEKATSSAVTYASMIFPYRVELDANTVR